MQTQVKRGSNLIDKMNNSTTRLFFYLVLQAVLYVSFLTLDITEIHTDLSNKIKFTMIVLCFCYVLFSQKGTDKSILFYVRTALFFTVISDLFLLLLDYYMYGVITFIIVQQLYGLKLDYEANNPNIRGNRRIRFRSFLIRICLQALLSVIICFILKAMEIQLELLLIITIFYFISIVTNVIRAVHLAFHAVNRKSSCIFAAGMVLFLLCDINVGLFNMSSYLSLTKELYDLIYSVSSILMWTFYAPSQVLISISAAKSGIQQNRQKN